MSAFTEAERVQIRSYLGASRMYIASDPRLESAITNAQTSAEGGSAPDDSTETYIRSLIVNLQGVDTRIKALQAQKGASAVDEIRVDPAREHGRLCKEGRMWVARLSDVLRYRPLRDVFGGIEPEGDGGGQLQQY